MEILFLDAAANLGFAYGHPGQCPISGSVEVWDKIQPIEIACGRAARWLVAHIKRRRPDLIGIEHPQSSAVLKSGRGSARSTDSQLMINGALHGVAGVYGIGADAPWPNTIRSQICGRAYAPKYYDPIKKKIVDGDTKQMVIDTMIWLGYVAKGCDDSDQCDAVCGWAYLSAVHGKSAPPLVLRG